jgi:hypothetical protein
LASAQMCHCLRHQNSTVTFISWIRVPQ